jgi:hypothetical protein
MRESSDETGGRVRSWRGLDFGGEFSVVMPDVCDVYHSRNHSDLGIS